jgi:hypothetical protein
MKYRVELMIDQEKLNMATEIYPNIAYKSKSMINALEREQVGNIISTALGSLFDSVEITTVRKISPIKRTVS